MCPNAVIQDLWYCTKYDERYVRIMTSLFTVICNLSGRRTAHNEMMNVTQHFKQIFTIEFTVTATESGYEIVTIVLYVL